ncbi:MAG: hypothetical protein RLZ57_1229 [Actinomycetota bacterium]
MKRIATLFMSVVLLSSVLIAPANAVVNIGDRCSKNGMVFAKYLICKKVKGKLVWQMNKIKESVAASIWPDTAGTICAADPNVPKEWAEYEIFAMKMFHCSRPLRFQDVALPSVKPKTTLTPINPNVEPCKIDPVGQGSTVVLRPNRWKFSGDLNIPIIPIQFRDYPTDKKPGDEYREYFKYLKEMFYKISDGNTRINFIVPDKYFDIGATIESYVIPGVVSENDGRFNWKQMDVPKYTKDVFAVADKNIDFTGIDMAVHVVPFNTPNTYIPHNQTFRMDFIQTNEGVVDFNYLWPVPAWTDDMAWYGAEPFLHLHEFFHANGLLDDHYGDNFGQSGPNQGTGNWGNMSGMVTDFIVWDKWIASMVKDSQIICTDPKVTTTSWLKPMEYFGDYEKMLVVPISRTKAIAIESHRAGGMNFKLNKASQGALVYLINSEDTRHGFGINVVKPSNRKTIYGDRFFVLADAPLKLNESVTLEGYKITVVEAGTFGDVVKVEKV